jgi:1-acyl-sn-glycerol-3-phosphate acyltransferase
MDAGSDAASRDRTSLLYAVIRLIFQACGFIFYATTECHGLEGFPEQGEPTLLCFNHGNGLADPLCLIKATPRMVRFCAKDTLWSVPIMKYFIRNSGAVPIYRQREHGNQVRRRVWRMRWEGAWGAGCCLFENCAG